MRSSVAEEQLLHEIDDKVLIFTKHLNLLKYLTPSNLVQERTHFIEAQGEYNPQFTYNFPEEKDIISRIQALHDLQISYFENKTYSNPISKLLSDKIEEHILTAELLLAYCRQDFARIAIYNTALFGEFDPVILQQAEQMVHTYHEPQADLRGDILTGDEIRQYILGYLQRNDITGVDISPNEHMLSKFTIAFGKHSCRLSYSPHMKVRAHALEADLIHEFTHYQRYLGGKQTGWHILTFGTKNYLTDDEGLALYRVCEYKKTVFPAFQKIGIYQKYLLLNYSQNKSFTTIVHYIKEQGRSKHLNTLFTMAMRCKQGIQDTSREVMGNIFLKNKLYADGYRRIHDRILAGDNLSTLMQAKITIEDLQHLAG